MAELRGLRAGMTSSKIRWAMLTALLALMLRNPLGWLAALLPVHDDPALHYALLALRELVVWGLPALMLRPWKSAVYPKVKRWFLPCAGAFALGLAAQGALMTVTSRWAQWLGLELSRMLLPANGAQWLLAVLALVIVPAAAEEAFFRGGLLTALSERAAPWAAAMLSTALFALMHGSLAGLPAHLAASLLCTLCMMRWGRLRFSVSFHLGYNAAALLLAGWEGNPALSLALGVLLTAGALAMAGGISWYSHGRRMAGRDRALCALLLLAAASLYLPDLFS